MMFIKLAQTHKKKKKYKIKNLTSLTPLFAQTGCSAYSDPRRPTIIHRYPSGITGEDSLSWRRKLLALDSTLAARPQTRVARYRFIFI